MINDEELSKLWNEVEVWKNVTIEGYSDIYEVSSFGRVRNKQTGRYLKPVDKKGYQRVRLCSNKVGKSIGVHRLLMLAFCPIEDETMEVHHKDGNKANNNISNLSWVTHIENVNAPEELERRDYRKAATIERHERERLERKAIRHAKAIEHRRECRRKYYRENKESEIAKGKIWREANKEKVASYKKNWVDSHREDINSYMRDYNKKNKEKLAEIRRARKESMSAEELQALKEKKRAYDKARYERMKLTNSATILG